MNHEEVTLEEKLAHLRVEYENLLPKKLQQLAIAWDDAKGSEDPQPHLERVFSLVHSLSGSGSTFGFSELSLIAKNMEKLVNECLLGKIDFDSKFRDLFQPQFRALTKASAVKDLEPQIDSLPVDWVPPIKPPATPRRENQHLVWFGGEPRAFLEFQTQLENFYFTVDSFRHPQECPPLGDDFRPAAFIVEPPPGLDGDDNQQDYFRLVKELAQDIPVVYIAPTQDDFSHSLNAIRAGAAACCSAPLDLLELVEKVDRLIQTKEESPYRLLILDQDKILADHIAAILRKAGMKVIVAIDPLKVMKTLRRFKPDLILMDIHLPDCTGVELATLIRQNEEFVRTPIVYHSSETEIDHRLAALDAGGDDFLFKPVQYRYLFYSLTSRMRRARSLRSLLVRDSLTGLLNHSEVQKRLAVAIAHADKNGRALSFAVVGPDHLHKVNEFHGHKTGDRVLVVLAKILERRVRGHGWVGRYGGGEFAIVLPGKNCQQTVELLEEIRDHFANMIFRTTSDFGEFQLTFSCGISEYADLGSASTLTDAAARALYRSRRMGGNHVLTYKSELDETGPLTFTIGIQTQDGEQALALDGGGGVPTSEEAAFFESLFGGSTQAKRIKAKIMVVDDDKYLLSMIALHLKEKGYDTLALSTGDAAYEQAQTFRPDLVLTDLLLMPGIHGFELCRKLKTLGFLTGVKVIVMTSIYKGYRHQLEAKEAGADDFLEKPLDFKALHKKIEALLGKG